jgi:hypothetical protein
MSLSVLCITNGEPHAGVFVWRMYELAERLGIELILGLDREAAQAAKYPCHQSINLQAVNLQEDVMDQAVEFCTTDYILRLDDDEVVSPALERWIASGQYAHIGDRIYAFPRVYMWPDDQHILTNDGIYPDLQTRLGKKACMFGVTSVHAGNPNGTGLVIPYAIEHHKLLVKTWEQRQKIAERYESLRPGAGTAPEYARYNLPERFYTALQYKAYSDGDYSR